MSSLFRGGSGGGSGGSGGRRRSRPKAELPSEAGTTSSLPPMLNIGPMIAQHGDASGAKNGKPTCQRPKCNRTLDLNENFICGGHACAYPTYVCKNHKSNKDTLCENHKRMAGSALPKHWARVAVGKVNMFLNIKAQVAQYDHPGSNVANVAPRMSRIPLSKPKKGVPTHFVASPQPPDLDDPWELVLAVPDVGKSKNYKHLDGVGAVFLYFNSADHSIQFSDPRPPKTSAEETLPAGWEQQYDEEGDPFYVNVDTGVKSYDDPRVVVNPVPSRSLSQEPESKVKIQRMGSGDAPKIAIKRDKTFTVDSIYEDPRTAPPTTANSEPDQSTEEPLPALPPTRTKAPSSANASATKPAVPQSTQPGGIANKPVSRQPVKRASSGHERKMPPKDAVWQIGQCDMFGYEMLDDCLTFEDEIPEAARNKVHNRYMDILPNPVTAITLPMIRNDPASVYVNANYVMGPNSDPHYYIAAMGPKPKTVENFWRMMWQEKPLSIVMVTGLVEKGVAKCERYWPGLADGKTMMTFGDIRVVNLQASPKKGYVRSTLKVVGLDRNGKRVSHTIEHFWYNTWPDHGVPRTAGTPLYTDDTLDMLSEVNHVMREKKKKGKTGPILMHCSAGIGRTGTCIAIDHCLYHLINSAFCDPLRTTAAIRQCRCALVQHPQQFKFVHQSCVRFAERMNKNYNIQTDNNRMDSMIRSMDAEAQKKLRREEKMAARERSETMSSPSGTRSKQTFSQAAGELSMGSIEFEGKYYTFVDPDGNGSMDIQEAMAAGFNRKLFKLLDGNGDGKVTPSEFKKFQREQRQKAAKARADAKASNSLVGSPQSVQQRLQRQRQNPQEARGSPQQSRQRQNPQEARGSPLQSRQRQNPQEARGSPQQSRQRQTPLEARGPSQQSRQLSPQRQQQVGASPQHRGASSPNRQAHLQQQQQLRQRQQQQSQQREQAQRAARPLGQETRGSNPFDHDMAASPVPIRERRISLVQSSSTGNDEEDSSDDDVHC